MSLELVVAEVDEEGESVLDKGGGVGIGVVPVDRDSGEAVGGVEKFE